MTQRGVTKEADAIRKRIQQLIGDYAGTENLRVVDVEWLRAIEWSGMIQGEDCCPVCGGRYPPHWGGSLYGHIDNCWLAKLIGGEE